LGTRSGVNRLAPISGLPVLRCSASAAFQVSQRNKVAVVVEAGERGARALVRRASQGRAAKISPANGPE
jgi:hypothetical protein